MYLSTYLESRNLLKYVLRIHEQNMYLSTYLESMSQSRNIRCGLDASGMEKVLLYQKYGVYKILLKISDLKCRYQRFVAKTDVVKSEVYYINKLL